MSNTMTVGEVVAAALDRLGVDHAFGVVSIHNMPMLDALARGNAIRFVMARGEAGAANMADGYARSAGRLGVVFTSTGPGAANAAGGLVARVNERWNYDPPDWVVHLAAACERSSQAEVAARIGYSASAVNQVLQNVYTGSLARVEQAVRGAILAEKVDCPVLEQLPREACARHQRRRSDQLTANPLLPKLYRACRAGCPHSLIKGKRHAEL